MTRLAFIAVLVATPVLAATVEDPDNPRFGEGLRVLGMRDQVTVERVLEVEGIDPEPLYLAHTPDREAFFRAGEDLCMAKGKLGHFVACNKPLAQAVERTITEPIHGDGITVWPRTVTRRDTGGAGGWTGSWGAGGGWYPILPPGVSPPDPPPETVPPVPAPVPLPSAAWMLIAALLTLTLWQRAMGARR